jgi:hypothetical protein
MPTSSHSEHPSRGAKPTDGKCIPTLINAFNPPDRSVSEYQHRMLTLKVTLNRYWQVTRSLNRPDIRMFRNYDKEFPQFLRPGTAFALSVCKVNEMHYNGTGQKVKMDIERQRKPTDVMDMPIRKPSDPLPAIFSSVRHSGFTTTRRSDVRKATGAAPKTREVMRPRSDN